MKNCHFCHSLLQGNAVIVSRSAANAKAKLQSEDSFPAEFDSGEKKNARDEQRRYANFWIGVHKSIHMKTHNVKVDKKTVQSRFAKHEVCSFVFYSWAVESSS